MCQSKLYDKNKMWKRDRKLHEVNETDSNDSQEDLACLKLYAIHEKDNDVIRLRPKIQGVELLIELDTGLALSLISYKDSKEKFPNTKLKKHFSEAENLHR